MYCRGNPVRYSDPSGYEPESWNIPQIRFLPPILPFPNREQYNEEIERAWRINRGISEIFEETGQSIQKVISDAKAGPEKIVREVKTVYPIAEPIIKSYLTRGGSKNVWPSKLIDEGYGPGNTTVEDLNRLLKEGKIDKNRDFKPARKLLERKNNPDGAKRPIK